MNLDCIARGEKLNVLASPADYLERATGAARELGLLDRYELETGPATGGVDSHWFAEAASRPSRSSTSPTTSTT